MIVKWYWLCTLRCSGIVQRRCRRVQILNMKDEQDRVTYIRWHYSLNLQLRRAFLAARISPERAAVRTIHLCLQFSRKKNINKKRCVMFSAGEVPPHRCSGDGKYLELSRILVQFVVNEKKSKILMKGPEESWVSSLLSCPAIIYRHIKRLKLRLCSGVRFENERRIQNLYRRHHVRWCSSSVYGYVYTDLGLYSFDSLYAFGSWLLSWAGSLTL